MYSLVVVVVVVIDSRLFLPYIVDRKSALLKMMGIARVKRSLLTLNNMHALRSSRGAFFCSSSAYSSTSNAQEDLKKPLVTLYQFATCPFCNRVKSFLDYQRVPYDTIEVNPISKKELKHFDPPVKQVPVAFFRDQVLTDSSHIIDRLHRDVVIPDKKTSGDKDNEMFMSAEALKWSEWGEKRLAVLLYPNITRTFPDSWAAFAYAGNVKSWSAFDRMSNRILGPLAMYAVRGKIKKKYNIQDERKELGELIQEWISALEKDRDPDSVKFLLGNSISIADVTIFGVLRGLEGLSTHEYVLDQGKTIKNWYRLVEAEVSNGGT